jgi:transposase InsO family protein
MANHLEVAKVLSIQTLYAQGWSQRRIARELGINRESVARHLKEAANSEGASVGSTDSKPTKVPTGSAATGSRSSCVPFQEVIEAKLEQGLTISKPEIFNTDQGCQFTSPKFTSVLEGHEIAISMDGRALDNVFIERLWRTVKYEDIYLKSYESVRQLTEGLQNYFKFYCHERPHSSLGKRTPADMYLQN